MVTEEGGGGKNAKKYDYVICERSLSAFLEDGDISIDSTRAEIGSFMDSLSVNEDSTWQGELVWKKTIKKLNDTVERASEAIGEGEEVFNVVKEIRKMCDCQFLRYRASKLKN